MSTTTKHVNVSFRLPVELVESIDAEVKRRKPEIKDRTQLVEIAIHKFLDTLQEPPH